MDKFDELFRVHSFGDELELEVTSPLDMNDLDGLTIRPMAY